MVSQNSWTCGKHVWCQKCRECGSIVRIKEKHRVWFALYTYFLAQLLEMMLKMWRNPEYLLAKFLDIFEGPSYMSMLIFNHNLSDPMIISKQLYCFALRLICVRGGVPEPGLASNTHPEPMVSDQLGSTS